MPKPTPLLLTTPPLTVFEQMALDDTLVRARAQSITLRFYNWTSTPAVTFGYAQFISEVRRQLHAHSFTGEICRRPTGGGMVYHRDDLTFSLIFPSQGKPSEIYKKLHTHIHATLETAGLSTQVVTQNFPAAAYAPSQNHQANACFINPVENDLLLANGQKMLGGAIRRFGNTVLYQGSLQVPQARTQPKYKQALIEAVRGFLATDLRITPVSSPWLETARTWATTQYNTPGWTEKF